MAQATQLKFDELNRLFNYREFFGKMYISKKQMDERIELAEEIELVMLWLFAYWDVKDDLGITTQDLKDEAKQKLIPLYERYVKLDDYITTHIDKTVDEIIDSTENHTRPEEDAKREKQAIEGISIKGKGEGESDEGEKEASNIGYGYWTSRERAKIISANEANALKNYTEYREAKISGKTKKRWLTEQDDKVRLTHTLVDEKTVKIDGLFSVGGSLMRFPKDTMYDPAPEEIVNCRCSCVYE